MPRSVGFDVPKLTRLLCQLGWSHAELAEHAGLSRRTVERLFQNGHATPSTHSAILGAVQTGLRKMEQSFDVPASLATENGDVSVAVKQVAVELVINQEFDSFTDSQRAKVLDAIATLLEANQDITVRQVRRG